MNLKDGELLFTLKCDRCRGTMIFSANVERQDAVTKLLLNHGWVHEGKNLYCDGCGKMLAEDKPKKKSKLSKKNVKPVIKEVAKKSDDDDGYIEL